MEKNLLNKLSLTEIAKFLSCKELSSFSMANSYLNLNIDNKKNPVINRIFMEGANRDFYDNNLEEKNIFSESKCDDFEKTENNWKKIYFALYNNKLNFHKEFPYKPLVEKVYQYFKCHCYLLNLRKECRELEFSEGSTLLTFCYDLLCKQNMYFNHYDKYLLGKEKKNKIELYKKGNNFFNKELLNYFDLLKELKENESLKEMVNLLMNYDYKKIIETYKNGYIKNDFFLFVAWMINTGYLFIDFNKRYIENYKGEELDEDKAMLYEFSNRHNGFAHFSLLLEEKFENVNTIISYLYEYILEENNLKDTKREIKNKYLGKDCFSFLKLFMKMEKEILFDKLKEQLFSKFERIFNEFVNEIFNIKEKKNEEKNEIEYMEVEEEETSLFTQSENEQSKEEEILKYYNNLFGEEEKSNKMVCLNFVTSVMDFSINEKNANVINHSSIKMGEEYKTLEGIMAGVFINKIKELTQYNTIDIKQLIKDFFDSSKMFEMIPRTKQNILLEVTKSLSEYIKEEIGKEFKEYIEENLENILKINKNSFQLQESECNGGVIMFNENKKYLKRIVPKIRKEGKEQFNKQMDDLISFLVNVLNDKIKNLNETTKRVVIQSYLTNEKKNCNKIESLIKLINYVYKQIMLILNKNHYVEEKLENKRQRVYVYCFPVKRKEWQIVKDSVTQDKKQTESVNLYEKIKDCLLLKVAF